MADMMTLMVEAIKAAQDPQKEMKRDFWSTKTQKLMLCHPPFSNGFQR